jgi:hypothetical protein
VIPGRERYILLMEQRDEWDGSERQQNDLVSKFASYLKFATEGEPPELHRRYPDAKTKPERPEIRLVYKTLPPDTLVPVIERLSETAANAGLDFAAFPLVA